MIFILMVVTFLVIITLSIVGGSLMFNKPNIKPFRLRDIVKGKKK